MFSHEESCGERESALVIRDEIDQLKAFDDLGGRAFQEEFAVFDHADMVCKPFEITQAVG